MFWGTWIPSSRVWWRSLCLSRFIFTMAWKEKEATHIPTKCSFWVRFSIFFENCSFSFWMMNASIGGIPSLKPRAPLPQSCTSKQRSKIRSQKIISLTESWSQGISNENPTTPPRKTRNDMEPPQNHRSHLVPKIGMFNLYFFFYLDLLWKCWRKKSKHIIPTGGEFHGDESHGIPIRKKNHLINKSK